METYTKYLNLLGTNAANFRKLDSFAYNYYKDAYKSSSDVSEFEQNHLEDLERDMNKTLLS